MAAADEGGWRALDQFRSLRTGDADAQSAAADAILGLKLDGRGVPDDVEQLLKALKVAQIAMKGERTKADRAASGAADGALQEAKAEIRRLKE